uniref:Uncharacterized protein n=1 Tax=Solanum lycopersicum TaxID=4081 RepID=K4D965_SOLLC
MSVPVSLTRCGIPKIIPAVLRKHVRAKPDHGPPFSSLLGAYQGVPLVTGILAQAIEGGGKRRIFAICNYIKQRLLHPVHIWSMNVLSSLKTDGIFNQERPLQYLRLKRQKSCYSFDLKSATDRWPLSVIYTLIEMIWGST